MSDERFTPTLDKLYLEWSQHTTVKTDRELHLGREVERLLIALAAEKRLFASRVDDFALAEAEVERLQDAATARDQLSAALSVKQAEVERLKVALVVRDVKNDRLRADGMDAAAKIAKDARGWDHLEIERRILTAAKQLAGEADSREPITEEHREHARRQLRPVIDAIDSAGKELTGEAGSGSRLTYADGRHDGMQAAVNAFHDMGGEFLDRVAIQGRIVASQETTGETKDDAVDPGSPGEIGGAQT